MTEEGTITKGLLKTKSGEFDLESIHTISLKNSELNNLGCIGECTCLQHADLSYNGLTKLHKLAGLENVQYLNLAANSISSLEGLQSLNNIEKLNIAGNLIGGVDVLRCLTGLEKLTSLRLRDNTRGLANPVCMNRSYTTDVTNMFPNLISLDGERISGRGSDVFKMFKQIDAALEGRSSLNEEENQSAIDWVPDNYWEPSHKFEQSILGDAQQQLQDLLSSCTRLTDQADEKLQMLKSGT